MKNQLLLCAFVASLSACQRESTIQPNPASPADEVAGTYRTNVYLDPSSVALSPGQVPYAEINVETDSTVAIVYTRLHPEKNIRYLPNVDVKRQPDGIQLQRAGSSIGTLQIDRIFTNNGMEKQGKLLRMSIPIDSSNVINFAGFR